MPLHTCPHCRRECHGPDADTELRSRKPKPPRKRDDAFEATATAAGTVTLADLPAGDFISRG